MSVPPRRETRACDGRAGSLADLERRLRYELEALSYPGETWTDRYAAPEIARALDVLIVGAGQAGLALSFALRREMVTDVRLVDAAAEGQEGVWPTFARMPSLRTPKYLTGPDYGFPSLTFRAWYDARGLHPTWDALDRIPTGLWGDYLGWYRRVLDIPVENETSLVAVRPAQNDLVAAILEKGGKRTEVTCRKVVLATGMDGGGRWTVPQNLAEDLSPERFAHTADRIDFDRLKGRRIAVLGLGASALDNASAALEAGAARVDQFFRRAEVPKADVRAWLENAGFLRHFGDLDDATRWRVMRCICGSSAPPPQWSLDRALADPRFHLHAGTPWLATREAGAAIEIDTPRGTYEADFIIFGTGAVTDLRLRPELAPLVDDIALWRDRFTPPADQACPALETYPYLGPGFQLLEKRAGSAPWLSNIHLFNWGATASLGVTAASITGMKTGLERLVRGLTRDLYLSVAERHAASIPWYDGVPSAVE